MSSQALQLTQTLLEESLAGFQELGDPARMAHALERYLGSNHVTVVR